VPADFAAGDGKPDAVTVRELLTGRYRVPDAAVVTRRVSNCTLREARGLRDLCAERGTPRLTAVTHAYHAARTARYLDEALPGRARVVPVTERSLAALRLPEAAGPLFAGLPELIRRSRPRGPDAWREAMVEAAMTLLHALDRGGRVEIFLADRVRNPPPP
jgi:uncharacterized SAM-binding protein YcdF (DUF218 family)